MSERLLQFASWLVGSLDWLYVVLRTVLSTIAALQHVTAVVAGLFSPRGKKARRVAERSMFGSQGWGNVDAAMNVVDSLPHVIGLKPRDEKLALGDDTYFKAMDYSYHNIINKRGSMKLRKYNVSARLARSMQSTFMKARSSAASPNHGGGGGGLPSAAEGIDCFVFNFQSPLADLLEATAGSTEINELRNAEFIVVWPRGVPYPDCFDATDVSSGATAEKGGAKGSSSSTLDGITILLPATGEQRPAERLLIGARLAGSRRCATLIPTAPFYWHRRPRGQRLHHVTTISGIFAQGLAVSLEAATVALALALNTPSTVPITLSGFSWGGAMTVVGSLVFSMFSARLRMDYGDDRGDTRAAPQRVTAIPYVGAGSPAVLVEGILAADVHWEVIEKQLKNGLASRGPLSKHVVDMYRTASSEAGSPTGSRALAVETLRRLFRQMDTANSARHAGDGLRGRLGFVHSIVTTNDHFVFQWMGEAMHDDAKVLLPTPSSTSIGSVVDKITYVGGGHVAAFMTKEGHLTEAILQSFDRVSAAA